MYMHKFSQTELLNEVFSDILAGALKVGGKAAASTLKGAVKMVTPTGADVLRNIRTAVQKGVALFTQEQANVVARKYLQDKYESSGSMFNIRELGQSKGNLQGRLLGLTEKEKQEEKEQAKANQAQNTTTQTTNSSTQPLVQQRAAATTTNTSSVTEAAVRGLPRPNELTVPNTQVGAPAINQTGSGMRQAKGRVIEPTTTTPQKQQTPVKQPPTQQQGVKQREIEDHTWPFRFVFFEADVLLDIKVPGAGGRSRASREESPIKSKKDEYRKIKFGVKLTKTTKDGDRQWTVLGLTNTDGTKFTGIIDVPKDNMKIADSPKSPNDQPAAAAPTEVKKPSQSQNLIGNNSSLDTRSDSDTMNLNYSPAKNIENKDETKNLENKPEEVKNIEDAPESEIKAGTKVKWQTSRGNVGEGEVVDNKPEAQIDPETQISVKMSDGRIVVVKKDKIIKEGASHFNLIKNTKFESIFRF
jgi:hypothetical protein